MLHDLCSFFDLKKLVSITGVEMVQLAHFNIGFEHAFLSDSAQFIYCHEAATFRVFKLNYIPSV